MLDKKTLNFLEFVADIKTETTQIEAFSGDWYDKERCNRGRFMSYLTVAEYNRVEIPLILYDEADNHYGKKKEN